MGWSRYEDSVHSSSLEQMVGLWSRRRGGAHPLLCPLLGLAQNLLRWIPSAGCIKAI